MFFIYLYFFLCLVVVNLFCYLFHLFIFIFFFFFKQKTAYEMRISDWSSDVCSSDLRPFSKDLTPRHSPSRCHFDKLNGSSGRTVVLIDTNFGTSARHDFLGLYASLPRWQLLCRSYRPFGASCRTASGQDRKSTRLNSSH